MKRKLQFRRGRGEQTLFGSKWKGAGQAAKSNSAAFGWLAKPNAAPSALVALKNDGAAFRLRFQAVKVAFHLKSRRVSRVSRPLFLAEGANFAMLNRELNHHVTN